MTSFSEIHSDLQQAKEWVYDPCKFVCSPAISEPESSEYAAAQFTLGLRSIRFRVAKTTPTKIGQFVTLWKRAKKGAPIQPYDISDPVDFFVISTRKAGCFGQFVFPKSVLQEHDIVSTQGRGGKRGIRVYPPWDKPTSKQALKTQAWQVGYFLEIAIPGGCDSTRARFLYSCPHTPS